MTDFLMKLLPLCIFTYFNINGYNYKKYNFVVRIFILELVLRLHEKKTSTPGI